MMFFCLLLVFATCGYSKLVAEDTLSDLAKVCKCSREPTRNCACCQLIQIGVVNGTLCLNISIDNSADGFVDLSLSLNTKILFAKREPISALTKKFCAPSFIIAKQNVTLCFQFDQLNITKTSFGGCAHIYIAVGSLNFQFVYCFNLPGSSDKLSNLLQRQTLNRLIDSNSLSSRDKKLPRRNKGSTSI